MPQQALLPQQPPFDPPLPQQTLVFGQQLVRGPGPHRDDPALQVTPHVLLLHVPVPLPKLGPGQVCPHEPQLPALFVVLVSQPVAYEPSQLAKPALHEATVQIPDTHAAVPFATEQTLPQVPQLLTSVLVLASQPLAGLPSQLAKPELHATSWHVPDTQAARPFAAAQTFPQVPQFVIVVRDVSQPFVALPSQLPYPPVHTNKVQTPDWQVALAAFGSEHGVLLGLIGLEQAPVDESHVPTSWHWSSAVQETGLPPIHAPFWQVSVWVQALPSLQAVPFAFAGLEHTPVLGSHVPAVWHWFWAVQVTVVVPGVQTPSWQESPNVQALPSPHG